MALQVRQLLEKLEDLNLNPQYSCCVWLHMCLQLVFWEAEARKLLSLTGCQPTFRSSETSAMCQRNMTERGRAGWFMASVLTPPPPPIHTPVATASLQIVLGTVVHAYNPSHLGSQDKRIATSKTVTFQQKLYHWAEFPALIKKKIKVGKTWVWTVKIATVFFFLLSCVNFRNLTKIFKGTWE